VKKGYKALLAEAEAEAGAEIETAPVERALSLHGQDGVVFVDLRDPREIQREGRIPGSFHCPRGMLEFWVDPESPYAKQRVGSSKWPQLLGYGRTSAAELLARRRRLLCARR
jgi:rhodanese-related sulfurtransferase